MLEFGYGKTLRLRKKGEFDGVLARKKFYRGRYFLLYHYKNQLPHSRLGIITSRRSAASAVKRNRIRRVIKEFFRHQHSELPCCDLVLIARYTAAKASNDQLRYCLHRLCQQLSRYYQQ